MKKVLLFDTALGTSNNGDEIIFDSVKSGLRPVLSNALCFRLATHIENYSPFQMLHPGRKLSSICFQADYKFVCGTNLLVNNFLRVRPQWWIHRSNAKIYENSILVGVGKHDNYTEIKNQYTKDLYKRVLSSDYKHSVRDEATKDIVESLGFKAINTGCPTLWMFDEQKCKSIPAGKAENVIFSVSGYSYQQDPEKDRQMLDCLIKHYNQCYAWIQTTDDEAYLHQLLNGINTPPINCIYSLMRFEDVLNQGNVDYVGTRLHGGVFAMQHNARSIIISIDQRAEGFYESNNIPIVRREDVSELGERIESSFETNIRVNHEGITSFVSQFI